MSFCIQNRKDALEKHSACVVAPNFRLLNLKFTARDFTTEMHILGI